MAPYKIAVLDSPVAQVLALTNTPLLKQKGAVLWFTANNKELKNRADLLKIFCPALNAGSILTWPDAEEPNLDVLIALYQNQTCLILTTANNLEIPIASFKYLRDHSITLAPGLEYNLYQLKSDLVALGVDFTARGSVLDIYQNNQLLRFNFEHNTIESGAGTIYPAKTRHKEKLASALPDFVQLIYSQEFEEILKNYQNSQIVFDSLAQKPDYKFATQSIDPFSKTNKIDNLKNKKIIWFSKNKAQAQKIAQAHNLDCQIIDWTHGLTWPEMFVSDKITVINDNLFFLSDERIPHLMRDKKRAVFTPDFEVGDIVVHRDHGLALFEKIDMLEVDGTKREYLVLKYAQNDTLFVPIDLADKIEKYIGPDNPKINRLSIGNTWPTTLRKIKNQTLELARELLIIEATRKLHTTPKLTPGSLSQAVDQDFEYNLTPSQIQAIKDIEHDLKSDYPSDRLVCGDVGFGKTEVALRAAAITCDSGWQTAVLCPTTLLAQQHYDNFVKRLGSHGARIALLTRWQDQKQIKRDIEAIKNGQIDIIIGTHRLLSRDIVIPKLQLLIIDEEQNFGVEDKEKLKKHKKNINVLTLTATPIPRTLNLALSWVKDISLITHPIQDRKNIITTVAPFGDKIIIDAINQELQRHGQVYFLYNQVETIDLAFKHLKKLFPKSRIAIAHGQLEDQKLASVMHDFDTGKIDILVCSTIIANGLDIPRANTLIVHKAEKFGLGQLHQLRGRIGRSDKQAYAYFLHSGQKLAKDSKNRLAFLKTASDLGAGFKIAHRDMELRGVGNILGKTQSGKVKAVGLGMYQQLITETVLEIKGQKIKNWRDIEIRLDLDTTLPHDSLKTYQKLCRIRDLDELNLEISKTDNQNMKNILALQKIKILAQNTDITSITAYKTKEHKNIAINFLSDLDPKKFGKILEINDNWQYGDKQIKIKQEFLKSDFMTELEKIIKILSRI